MTIREYPYTLSKGKNDKDEDIYYAEFKDGNKNSQKKKISFDIYQTLIEEKRKLRNICRMEERNTEQFEFNEFTVSERASDLPKTLEEIVIEKEEKLKLRSVVLKLPNLQRKRLILHYDYQLTYQQIADIEGCSVMAVKYSIDKAKDEIVNNL